MDERSSESRGLVTFGVFELDLAAGELRRSGVHLRLQQQPLQLLSLLVERPGEIVTRDELQRRLWPNDTFIDFEHGLNAAVRRLRDTLGDSADAPRFVETVPRRGYRFIAPCRASLHDVETAPVTVPVKRLRRPFLLLAAVLGLLGAGLVFYLTKHAQVASSSFLADVPLTSLPGQEVAPTFSPDGSQIAFARMAEEGSGIYLMSPLGGRERQVAEGRFEYFLQTMLSWSPDGKFIAFYDKGPSGRFGISLLDVATFEKEWRENPSSDCMWSWVPAFSPDKRSLAVACMVSYGVNDLYVLPVSGGTGQRLVRVQGGLGGMIWTPDSDSVMYSIDGDLWRVAAWGGQPERVLIGRGIAMPAISREGRRLADTRGTAGTANLWQVPLSVATKTAGPPTRLLASSRSHNRPSFSPDGRRLAFNSNRSGALEVWTSDVDGSNAVRLTAFGGPWTGSPRWSPDGLSIAFDSHGVDRSKIYIVRSNGGASTPVATGVEDSSTPAWSRDGKWLYFGGRVDGVAQIFKVSKDGGTATQLTTKGGFGPIFTASEDRVYYTTQTAICSVSSNGGDERCVSGLPALRTEYCESWTLSPDGIYFVRPDLHRPGIDFFAFASGRTVPVVDVPGRPEPWGGSLAL